MEKIQATEFGIMMVRMTSETQIRTTARKASELREESEATRFESAVVSGIALGGEQSYNRLAPLLKIQRKVMIDALREMDKALLEQDPMFQIAAARRVIVEHFADQRTKAMKQLATQLAAKYLTDAHNVESNDPITDADAMATGMAASLAVPHGFAGFLKYGSAPEMECHCPTCYGARLVEAETTSAELDAIARADTDGKAEMIKYGRVLVADARKVYRAGMAEYDLDDSLIDEKEAEAIAKGAIEKMTGGPRPE